MSNISLSCGHAVDRIFHLLTNDGAKAHKLFKKKFGRVFTVNMEKHGAKFKDEFLMFENFDEEKTYYQICPSCLSTWEHNT